MISSPVRHSNLHFFKSIILRHNFEQQKQKSYLSRCLLNKHLNPYKIITATLHSSNQKTNDLMTKNSKYSDLKFIFRYTNDLEVGELVKRIKISKASGIKRISSYLIKECLIC